MNIRRGQRYGIGLDEHAIIWLRPTLELGLIPEPSSRKMRARACSCRPFPELSPDQALRTGRVLHSQFAVPLGALGEELQILRVLGGHRPKLQKCHDPLPVVGAMT